VPELPEVETIVRALGPLLQGQRIVSAEFLTSRVLRHADPPDLAGARILQVHRHGKNIVLTLDRGLLVIHLGMTGKLLMDGATGPYTRAIFQLEHGLLVYEDVRQFGRIEWSETLPDRLAGLGPEPLTISFEDFLERLRARPGRIKSLLLNQRFLRGLGNIYVDESLFRSALHPITATSRIGTDRARRLYAAIREVLTLAIEHRGSSVSDYVDVEGRKGGFQQLHSVYGREGQPCPHCGTAIRRIVVAQRGTHFCPKCQRG
jgi:formamidopyrimidine-DNA glycosylase